MLEEAKESLRGIDINGLVSQGLDEGIQSIDTQVLKARAETDFKIGDRKSTRLNSSHANISYAVFCLKKKNTNKKTKKNTI